MGAGCLSITLLLLVTTLAGIAEGRKKLFCYFSSAARYRLGPGQFQPEDIDPQLCTHIIFAFIQPTSDGLDVTPEEPNHLGYHGLYARTVGLKRRNPDLRILLAIGGWVIGSKPFLPIIANSTTITTFAKNVVNYLRKHGMDGMDVDWEFPGVRGSKPKDKVMFTLLLKTLQDEFMREAHRTSREKLILTVATAAGGYYIEAGYEPKKMVLYPDYLLLMTYNYHGSWENVTGHHSAVWPSHLDTGPRKQLSMKWTVDYWLSKGARPDKVILGLATYGMTFTLMDPKVHGLLAPSHGGGRPAQYTRETGIMAYYEVCENLAQHGWTKVWIQDQQCPYAYGGDQWVGYDDPKSLRIKVQVLLNNYKLGGAFVWSVETDDFRGRCGQGPYPLLRTIISTMDAGTTTTGTPTPTHTSYAGFQCGVGSPVVQKDWSHCGQFFVCVTNLNGSYTRYTERCRSGSAFDDRYSVCIYDPSCV